MIDIIDGIYILVRIFGFMIKKKLFDLLFKIVLLFSRFCN